MGKRMGIGLLAAACAGMVVGCAGNKGGTRYDDPSAIAVLEPTQGNSVRGAVDFVRTGNDVTVTVSLSGFAPNSTHGIHIHEIGDCTARDGSSAGGHFNPMGAEHGGTSGAKRHGGDLGNIQADATGNVVATVKIDGVAFGTGTDSIVGRSLVVHAGADDLKSQPAGNSGARIACGIITRNPDRRTYAQTP
ncbi:MAG TPA: superoxide dismutase family protein [Burkholderiales bacterium]|jgi:Cu-Zn family superoxide dismutase|nr:superoxide dismutase family protein [Burkholderiales bacterium]